MKIKKAVFPVAGLGTRFIPATKAMAKEMLPIVDKPLIQYAVEEAFAAGIEQIIFVTGRGKKALEDHFDRSFEIEHALKKKGKDDLLKQIQELVPKTGTIIYTRQHEPLGLGHAIWCAKNIVGDEPFAVLLADDLIQTEKPVLSEMIRKFDRLRASMAAVMEVEKSQTDKYGIIDAQAVEEDIVKINDMVEKPSPEEAPSNLAIIGRYILTPKIFEYLEKKETGAGGEIQLTDAMKTLLKEQPIYGYKFEGQRFDCGDKAGFQMANLAFALERPDMKKKLMEFIKKL
ncbi:MAG: UTP--glucose-1-phosphate uridylyltransferase GalU [Desulfobacula sp.]|jgi:UTP--glucose-1-phosphate uridylyltransferase|uniref:UTP--glucose-1-phosphate uridylyltransferase GalU n=1 Tax=Desulfobacula sp. TaxID=2593537 RepID=UPI001DC38306|nr:UTP--glucose-1-phosphate uridylyltransferase GalU [Desulfobacula sp.]MBT3485122.1 UTP--glucose-1-phosphate uridylyltransferase GalU [Desulfobacula sp.]MBT3804574.1 UTP--glucose-1-phosphate uridylyltransferase GalU [Desulfobacula sp.]MBT4025133.1 UTP--glucose-1-phosphate uridylyltransferase GalU [Desulfobacula sp.]MBT4198287.1 UTP--glucose-1-phosphate uridylyltransferase GalU [Desulfobacula sp.]